MTKTFNFLVIPSATQHLFKSKTYIFFSSFVRIGSGKQVASVIVDDGKDQDDEDDTFVVEDPNAIQNDVDLVSSHQMVCLPLICGNYL